MKRNANARQNALAATTANAPRKIIAAAAANARNNFDHPSAGWIFLSGGLQKRFYMKKTKLINAAACCAVGFHFAVCGLPLLIALSGGTLSFSGWIGKPIMTALLILSGIMIIISVIAYIKNKCDCSPKTRRWQAVMLIIVSVLYASAVAGHFGAFAGTNETTEVLSCH
jgi:hypothetical protein